MRYNVAQLLREPIGSTRSFDLYEAFSGAERFADHVNGSIRLLRTHQGVLASADVRVDATLTCGRCLIEYPLDLTLSIEEEFFPIIEINTGRRLAVPLGAEGTQIDATHTLNLTEVLRQYVITDSPMKPICQPDCGGLCPQCGANLNHQECTCSTAEIDPRWQGLAGLLHHQ